MKRDEMLRSTTTTIGGAVVVVVVLLLSACCVSACSSDANEAAATSTTNDGGPSPPPSVDGGDTDSGSEVTTDGAVANDASNGLKGKLNVLSLNLHCLKNDGTSFATNEARFASIAKTVKDESIDVILAQEVCISTTANARTMLVAALENEAGTGAGTWSSAIAFAHKAWVGTPDEADEHVAIFTRGALSDPRENVHRAQSALRRLTLSATYAANILNAKGPTLPIRLNTLHFEYADATARAGQARETASFAMFEADDPKIAIDAVGGGVLLPVIIGGDFNAQNGTDATKALTDFGFVEKSATAPNTGIDHVFVHRSTPLTAVDTKELFTGAAAVSDHPGVLVRFEAGPTIAVKLTRIVANGAFAGPLAVRGDHAPLSWERGWPAYTRGSSAAALVVTSELPPGAFTYKFLRDDTTWATGANVSGMGETDNASTPSF